MSEILETQRDHRIQFFMQAVIPIWGAQRSPDLRSLSLLAR